MRPSDVYRLMDSLWLCGRSIHIEGQPGIGKTALAYQIAKAKGATLICRHPVFEEPVDVRLPVPNHKTRRTEWYAPDWLPDASDDRPYLLLIDELPQAENAMQKAYRPTILEGKVGDNFLPKNTQVISTGNRGKDRAGASRLFSHVSSALLRVEMEVSNDDWQQWALDAGVLPEVRSYLRFAPSSLCDFDPSLDQQQPMPRTWHAVSDTCRKCPDDLLHATVAASVGEAEAAKFAAFMRMFNELPDIDAVMRNPSGFKLPEKLDILHALCGAVAEKCRNADQNTIDAGLEIGLRCQDEFTMLLCRDVMTVSGGRWKTSRHKAALLKRRIGLGLED